MKKRKALFLSLLMCTTLLVSACGADDTNTNNNDVNNGETLSQIDNTKPVKIGVLSISDSFPFYVAEQEGLFEKHGVSVEILKFGSARDKDLAFESKELDADMTDLVVAGIMENGGTDVTVGATALGATTEEGRFCIVAHKDSGIKTLEDLKGVPVAVGNNTIVHYLAERLMADAGFTEEEIVTQNIPDLKLRLDTMLEGKDVKACVIPDPLATLAEKQGAIVVVDDTKIDKNLSQSVVIFHQDVVDTREAQIKAFMDAYYEAMEMINADPAKYREMAMTFANIPEILKETYPDQTYTAKSVPTEEQVNDVMGWLVDSNILKESINYADLVTDKFVK